LSAAVADQAVLPPNVLAHFERDFECFVVSQARAAAASAKYFDRLYDANSDPWRLATSFYERRKRSLLLASLPRSRFVRAFEPGCALGVLTDELADRCAEVIAWDGAPAAITQSASRLSRHENVHLEQRRIPHEWPDGAFDLIVLSEVGYYCDDLRRLADRCKRSLTEDGVLAACHWTHPAPDHPHTARAVHDALGAGLHRVVRHVESDFLLDVWSRDTRSVAVQDGILT
jgi:SAM-dependent methyltransferase